jgi:hypothetical protein
MGREEWVAEGGVDYQSCPIPITIDWDMLMIKNANDIVGHVLSLVRVYIQGLRSRTKAQQIRRYDAIAYLRKELDLMTPII